MKKFLCLKIEQLQKTTYKNTVIKDEKNDNVRKTKGNKQQRKN